MPGASDDVATHARLRVGFAGTPEFAAAALQALLDAGFEIPLVLSQPDRPAGRGLKLQASPVATLARAQGLSLAQPRSLRLDGKFPSDAQAAQAALQTADLDVLVVAAYGLILPAWVLATPRLGCLNIHASLLPRWRGAAPIQRAIEAGDSDTGITLMQMDEGLDTGAMLLRESTPIAADCTTAALHDRLASIGARLVVRGLHLALRGELQGVAQPQAGVCYAHKIDKREAALDWSQSAAQLERRIRAFDPFPGATLRLGDEVVKVWRAGLVPAVPGALPGQVQMAESQHWQVACGEGALALLEVQRPGGKRVAVAQALPGLLAAGVLKSGMRLPTSWG